MLLTRFLLPFLESVFNDPITGSRAHPLDFSSPSVSSFYFPYNYMIFIGWVILDISLTFWLLDGYVFLASGGKTHITGSFKAYKFIMVSLALAAMTCIVVAPAAYTLYRVLSSCPLVLAIAAMLLLAALFSVLTDIITRRLRQKEGGILNDRF